MSRKLKFRAWGSKWRRMINGDYITIYGHGAFDVDLTSENGDTIETISGPSEMAHLMQYTGMKDKAGKEIYEGDIVKWDDRSGGQYWRIADVRWEEHQWCFYDHVSKHLFEVGSFAYADSTEQDLEIIGNIHENPELLK